MVSPNRLIALDGRVLLQAADVGKKKLPKPAIRPYPDQYAGTWVTRDGTRVTIRPIRPEDEPLMIRFHESLSERSVYLRYFHLIGLGQRIAHERLTRICFVDYDREIVLVACAAQDEIIAVARLNKVPGTEDAEFAVIVTDRFQRRGLGREMLRRLIEIARQENLARITADILPDNRPMQDIFRNLGFQLQYLSDEELFKAELKL